MEFVPSNHARIVKNLQEQSYTLVFSFIVGDGVSRTLLLSILCNVSLSVVEY